jgi:uncharacterized protein YerC
MRISIVVKGEYGCLEPQRIPILKFFKDQKLEKLFRLILCRMPSEKEIKMLRDYFDKEKIRFNSNKQKAMAFLQAGEYPQIKTKDIAETAALMQVNQMLFNLDETTIK